MTTTPIADVMTEVAELTTLLIGRHAKQLAKLTGSAPATDLDSLTRQVEIAEDATERAAFTIARIFLKHLPDTATGYLPATLRDVDQKLTDAATAPPGTRSSSSSTAPSTTTPCTARSSPRTAAATAAPPRHPQCTEPATTGR